VNLRRRTDLRVPISRRASLAAHPRVLGFMTVATDAIAWLGFRAGIC